jgi:pyruvate-formate lyase-activating enzyme
VDGPGNRFVIFLQGCNLNCLACHNPHTIPMRSVRARDVSVADVVEQLRPLAPFLAGVTVSGGEPTVQAPFVGALFSSLSTAFPSLTRFLDSNGVAGPDVWDSLLPVTDGVMLDLKALDPSVHARLTGSDNALVLDSIRRVAAAGKLYETRLLLVPGINDDPATLEQTVGWLRDVDPAMRIKVIRFRRHGARAVARRWPEASDEQAGRYRAQLTDLGVRDLEVV